MQFCRASAVDDLSDAEVRLHGAVRECGVPASSGSDLFDDEARRDLWGARPMIADLIIAVVGLICLAVLLDVVRRWLVGKFR